MHLSLCHPYKHKKDYPSYAAMGMNLRHYEEGNTQQQQDPPHSPSSLRARGMPHWLS